jgi:hypothetical protein
VNEPLQTKPTLIIPRRRGDQGSLIHAGRGQAAKALNPPVRSFRYDLEFIYLVGTDVHEFAVQKADVPSDRINSADLAGKTCVFDLDERSAFAGQE